jgi:hypothetical protein
VGPVPDPLLPIKSGSAGNRIRTSGFVARSSVHLTTEAVSTYVRIFIINQLPVFHLNYIYAGIFALNHSHEKSCVCKLDYWNEMVALLDFIHVAILKNLLLLFKRIQLYWNWSLSLGDTA